MTSAPLFLGVDGGATRCRARLRDADGRALAEANGAAANIHVDFAAAVAAMRAVVDEALGKAGLGDVHRGTIAIGLGLAGFKQGSDQTRVAAAFPGFRLVCAANDATTACIGAHAGADGGLVIAGTGSAAIARVGPRKPSLADAASRSATTDRAPISASMRCVPQCAHLTALQPASALTDDILAEFGGDPVAMMNWARRGETGRFRRVRAARVRACGAPMIRLRWGS